MTSLTLKPHQVEGIEWLRSKPRALLADSPRAGKTAQLLLAAEGKTLVVAPAGLQDVWRQEKKLWRPGLDLTFVSYSSVARRESRHTLPVPWPEYKYFDTVLCDEAHALVNLQADWVNAIKGIETERLYMATGTPIPNWASQLLMPLRLLFPGDKRFTNRAKWEEAWFKFITPPINPVTGKPRWGNAFTRKIDDLRDDKTWEEFWLENGLDGPDGRMLQREVDLGVPFTEQTIEVDMTPAQAKVYKALAKDYVAWTEENEEVSAWSSGGLHTKLLQCSTGLETLTEGSKSSGKFDVLHPFFAESPRSPTLVFCFFKSTSRALFELAKSMGLRVGIINGDIPPGIERHKVERDFRNGKLDLVVGTLSTTAQGLEFARARTEIFVEHTYSPWRNDQAIKRAMVMGKKDAVRIIHLYTKHTADIGARSLTQAKTDQQVKALTAREFRSIIYG